MKVAFTIVTKNYIGLAKVLRDSIYEKSGVHCYIFVADETDNLDLPDYVITSKKVLNIEESLWQELTFKYNLVEFCTALKPFIFKYLFEFKNFEKILYFDPDIYLYGDLKYLFQELDQNSIILTPHICHPKEFNDELYEDLFLVNGTFNLGFIGIKNTHQSYVFLEWWGERLLNYCFYDNDQGLATDQKWINLIFSVIDVAHIKILYNLGYNVATWNFSEREIYLDNAEFFVRNRKTKDESTRLVFIHFSGFSFLDLVQKESNYIPALYTKYEDIKNPLNMYADKLKSSDFMKFINLPYSYNTFSNGCLIYSIHRRIFRAFLQSDSSFTNPFDVTSIFYKKLDTNGLINKKTTKIIKKTQHNTKNFDKKLKYVNLIFRFIFKLIGRERYLMMIKFFRRYFKEENQIFLIGNHKSYNY